MPFFITKHLDARQLTFFKAPGIGFVFQASGSVSLGFQKCLVQYDDLRLYFYLRSAWFNMVPWDFFSRSAWFNMVPWGFFQGAPGSIWCLEARLFSTLGLHTDCARWGEAAASTYLLLQNSLGLLQNSAPPKIPAPSYIIIYGSSETSAPK